MDKILQNISGILNQPLFHINEVPITLVGIFVFFIILISASLISKILRKILKNKLSSLSNMDQGVSYALLRILHYSIITIAFVTALQFIGVNLGSLAVIAGFLSVGIGFGLKNITSNFISGLILLFERPINVGDRITVGENLADIVQINMRSTKIRTPDNVSIIVPNSFFIEQEIINWSHGDKKIRLHIPVGTAYGSNVQKVKECLLEAASTHPKIMKKPEPLVWFKEFGNSSLNFELICWIETPEKMFDVKSDLNFSIDDIFRRENIEIPFPQMDLHFKSAKTALKIEKAYE